MASESLKAESLQASLTVKDVRASRDWYHDVLGFTVDREIEREGKLASVVLTAGGVRILLNQDDGKKGANRPLGQGFSFSIVSGQDIDAIAKRAKARGATLESEPADMPWGARVFRIVDPNGYKFAISSPRKG
jgi:uncharacterized glyoxalase superfamily protein PhnB